MRLSLKTNSAYLVLSTFWSTDYSNDNTGQQGAREAYLSLLWYSIPLKITTWVLADWRCELVHIKGRWGKGGPYRRWRPCLGQVIYAVVAVPAWTRSLNCVKCTQHLPHAGKLPSGSTQTTSFSRPLPALMLVGSSRGGKGIQLFKRSAKKQSFHAVLF